MLKSTHAKPGADVDTRRRSRPRDTMTAEEWNAAHPEGTPVFYRPLRSSPDGVETKTRSPAWALGSGDVVVAVEGRAGGVAIDHLTVREGAP